MDRPVFYRGRDKFLSNMFAAPIFVDGRIYSSVEQAYQYIKARSDRDFNVCNAVMASSDGFEAKAEAKAIVNHQRHRWNVVKADIIYRLAYEKFLRHRSIRNKLLGTQDHPLVENVADPYWGRGHNNNGANVAGQAMMTIRQHLRFGSAAFPPVLFVGDSIVRGVDLGNNSRTICLPGATADYVRTIATAVAGPSVQVLIVLAGTNDIVGRNEETGEQAFKDPPNLVAKQYRRWANNYAIHHPHRLVLICSITPRRHPAKVDIKIAKFNHRMADYVARYEMPPNVRFADVTSTIDPDIDLRQDGLHPSPSGRIQIAAAINAAINAAFY